MKLEILKYSSDTKNKVPWQQDKYFIKLDHSLNSFLLLSKKSKKGRSSHSPLFTLIHFFIIKVWLLNM